MRFFNEWRGDRLVETQNPFESQSFFILLHSNNIDSLFSWIENFHDEQYVRNDFNSEGLPQDHDIFYVSNLNDVSIEGKQAFPWNPERGQIHNKLRSVDRRL